MLGHQSESVVPGQTLESDQTQEARPLNIFELYPDLLDFKVADLLLHWAKVAPLTLTNFEQYQLKCLTASDPFAVLPANGIKAPSELFSLGIIPTEDNSIIREHALSLFGYLRSLTLEIQNDVLRGDILSDVTIGYSLLQALSHPRRQKVVNDILTRAHRRSAQSTIEKPSFKERATAAIASEQINTTEPQSKGMNTPVEVETSPATESENKDVDLLFNALEVLPELIHPPDADKKKKIPGVQRRDGERLAQTILRYLQGLEKKYQNTSALIPVITGFEINEMNIGTKEKPKFERVMVIGFKECSWSTIIPALQKILSTSVVNLNVDQVWQTLFQLSPQWELLEMVHEDFATRGDISKYKKRVISKICDLAKRVANAYKIEDQRIQQGFTHQSYRSAWENLAMRNLFPIRRMNIDKVVLEDQTPKEEVVQPAS